MAADPWDVFGSDSDEDPSATTVSWLRATMPPPESHMYPPAFDSPAFHLVLVLHRETPLPAPVYPHCYLPRAGIDLTYTKLPHTVKTSTVGLIFWVRFGGRYAASLEASVWSSWVSRQPSQSCDRLHTSGMVPQAQQEHAKTGQQGSNKHYVHGI